MLKILLSGCNGAMGRTISELALQKDTVSVVCGVDRNTEQKYNYPVFENFNNVSVDFDVIIDFSHPSVLSGLIDFAVKNKKPVVFATTGYNNEQLELIKAQQENIPVFFSANMSLCVSLMRELAVKAFSVLNMDYDTEIIEKHHNQKVDAPSGTAIMLVDAMTAEKQMHYEFDRHSKRQKRTKDEIGIHSVRGGTIVGEHEVIFAGTDEILTISHTAYSKKIFANGAISAAEFLSTCKNGLYGMADLINNK